MGLYLLYLARFVNIQFQPNLTNLFSHKVETILFFIVFTVYFYFYFFADYNRKIKIANLFEKTSMVTPLFALVFVGVIGYTHQKKYQVLLKIAYVVEALLIFFEVFQLVYISIAKSLPNPSGRIRYEVGVNGVRPPVKYAPLTPKENRISNFNVAGENHNSSSKENAKSSEKFSNVSEEHELFQRPSTFLKQGSDTEPSTSGLQPSKLKKNDFSAFYEKADSDDEDYDTPKLDHRNLFSSPSKKSSVVCVKIKPKPTIKPQSSAVNDETEVMIEETVL